MWWKAYPFNESTNEYSVQLQERRSRLIAFLRGSQKKKRELKEAYPEDYDYFQKVWQVKNNHMVENLPSNYVFLLLPCYKANCFYPVCTEEKPSSQPTCFKVAPLCLLYRFQFPIQKEDLELHVRVANINAMDTTRYLNVSMNPS